MCPTGLEVFFVLRGFYTITCDSYNAGNEEEKKGGKIKTCR